LDALTNDHPIVRRTLKDAPKLDVLPGSMPPKLLTVDDAKALSVGEMRSLFAGHINPGQLHFMKLLGFDKIKVQRALGMHYYDQDGRAILDFFGGFGSLAFGHNHPRIIAARKRFQDEERHEIAIAFMSQYAAALAKNLSAMSPGSLDMVFLGSSGSEAMEAAVKLAERAAPEGRKVIAYAQNSFHGKTKGVLTVTDGGLYRADFALPGNAARVPFGDLAALEALLETRKEVGVLVLETVQGGGGIIMAPTSYWRGVRALCDKHKVIWIADEVQCGYGRTGRFYAFQHHGVTPDITALAKSLGAGKAAVGAMIADRDIYMRAYGTPKTAMIHAQATFGGMGEACITAIEGLNVLQDEGLIENAEATGGYLLDRLETLRAKHPGLLKDVRGQGFMVGLEFHDFSQALPAMLRPVVAMLDDKLKGSLPGFIGSHLLADHAVLVAFTEYNRNVIRLEPPLICTRADVDRFIGALDEILSRGVTRIVKDFIARQIKG
jgi:ornithine--oxo-acid transaminase